MAKHFEVDFPSQDEFGNQYPLVFKVTKFLCGGFTVAVGLCHAACDGTEVSQFLRAVAKLASGKTEPYVKPASKRERLVGTIISQPIQNPMDNASVAVSSFLPSMDFSHECFKVDRESIARLRTSLMKESGNDYIRHSIDSMETKPVKFNYETGAIMTLTDWRYLGLLEKVDFGWKEPVNTMPVPCEMFGFLGLCTIFPLSNLDPSMSGGARVYVCLPNVAMPKFKKEMKALGSIQNV